MEENSSLVHMPRTRKPKIIVSISIIIWETPKPFPLNLTWWNKNTKYNI